MIAAQAGYYRLGSLAIYLLVVLLAFHTFVRLYEERRFIACLLKTYCRTVPRWLLRLRQE